MNPPGLTHKPECRRHRQDLGKFRACTQARAHEERVKQDKAYGRSLGVRGTPALFIDGGANRVGQLPGPEGPDRGPHRHHEER